MKYQCFKYSAEGEMKVDDLNAFLGSHRIISVQRDWVLGTRGSQLIFVVEYTHFSHQRRRGVA